MAARFELVPASIRSADSSIARVKVIKDYSTFEKITAPFGTVLAGQGYIRCHGKHFVGMFGQNSPVYGGSDGDVYYAPVSYFDGEWRHATANKGNFEYITEGELFDASEQFAGEAMV